MLTIHTCKITDYQNAENGDFKTVTIEDYKRLTNALIDEFGLNELNQLIFHKKKQILKLKAKYLYSESESLLTDIKLAEIELQRLQDKVKADGNLRQLQAKNHRIISKWAGRDTRTLTVFEYYNDLKDFIEDASQDRNR